MPQSLNCPNCSAPLDFSDNSLTTIRCPYCHTLVILSANHDVKPLGWSPDTPARQDYRGSQSAFVADQVEFVKSMALAGNKVLAARALRDIFAIDQDRATEVVEAMARGETVDTYLLPLVPPSRVAFPALDPSTVQQLMDLLRSGEKIEAIKLFRQATGVGLRDAKQVIESLESSISVAAVPGEPGSYPHTSYQPDLAKLNAPSGSSKRVSGLLSLGLILFLILVVVLPILAGMTSQGGPLAGVWARINPFNLGRVTLAFGKEGTGPGYFTGARFIALDNNGHIFVGEDSGGRVQVFDDTGKFLTQWMAEGEESGDIYLTGLAAGRDGSVYAVVGSQLYVYDGFNGNLLGRLEHPDGWGFDDVIVAPDGSILASWYKSRDDLLRFDRSGNLDLQVEDAIGQVTGDSEMESKLAIDGTGNIYDLAYFNQAVFIFSPQGRYITRFGSQGDAEGQFSSPRAIAVDNLGRVFIADFAGVMIYASDGRYLDTLSVNGAVMDMAFDDQNNLYLVAGNQVLRFKLK